MTDKCKFKYSQKYLNMTNNERIKYNKNIRKSLEILESIKHEITDTRFYSINLLIFH